MIPTCRQAPTTLSSRGGEHSNFDESVNQFAEQHYNKYRYTVRAVRKLHQQIARRAFLSFLSAVMLSPDAATMSAINDHSETVPRHVICCLLALEIAEYDVRPVFDQIRSTQRFPEAALRGDGACRSRGSHIDRSRRRRVVELSRRSGGMLCDCARNSRGRLHTGLLSKSTAAHRDQSRHGRDRGGRVRPPRT